MPPADRRYFAWPMGQVLQFELFTATAADPPWRDNRDAMEYPFLALQKKRTRPIEYRRGAVAIEVQAPQRYGIASIWDWDLIIFAASQLSDGIEAGLTPSPRLAFVPYDLLRQVGWGTSRRRYRELAQAVRQLRMTTVLTTIRTADDAGEERPFSWLTDYRIPKRYTRSHLTPAAPEGEPDPRRPWEIELPAWLYNAILRRRDILAVHPDYFRLTGGLERWLYRLARKAVPEQAVLDQHDRILPHPRPP